MDDNIIQASGVELEGVSNSNRRVTYQMRQSQAEIEGTLQWLSRRGRRRCRADTPSPSGLYDYRRPVGIFDTSLDPVGSVEFVYQ
ncbi:hypothetical protein FOVSG1_004590 [Fusarium oxysporum f. sp. vasinfectum]